MPYIESNDRGKAVKCFELHTVDYSNSSPIIISAQQGDTNSRIFEIAFRDDKGRLSLSEYTKVRLRGTLPNGESVYSDACEIITQEDGRDYVRVQFGGQFTSVVGKVSCDITLSSIDETQKSNKNLTSQAFYVIVYESRIGNVLSENNENYNELQELVDSANKIIASENEREKAEQVRVSNENERIEKDASRDSKIQEIKDTNSELVDVLCSILENLAGTST